VPDRAFSGATTGGFAGLPSLTQLDERLLPSTRDVDFYRTHGYYLSEPLFSPAELATAIEASERFYQGERDRVLPVKPSRSAYWEADQGDVQRHHDYIVYESDVLRRIFCKPLIAAVAARLIGTPVVRLWSSTLIYKPPRPDENTNIVPWHTDRHHWQTCTSDELVTAFVPLHDCEEEHGTLTVLDGSHRWRELPPRPGDDPTAHFAERSAEVLRSTVEEIAAHNGETARPVRLRYRAGQVSFHHCRTYHSSGPNLSPTPRRVLTIRFQDEDNAWRPARTPAGEPVVYSHDRMVRRTEAGTPDYRDPEFCPVLWPPDGSDA
jgi:ectoine hydroxylase-related dioxygenase (phytanoyl-CoA dioxygenase family)